MKLVEVVDGRGSRALVEEVAVCKVSTSFVYIKVCRLEEIISH